MKGFHLNTILFIILILFIPVQAQELPGYLFSPKNILRFADHLFAEKDYLRAIMEYQRYLNLSSNDTVSLRIAEGYFRMNKYRESKTEYRKLFNSTLHSEALLGFAKNEFFSGNYKALREPDLLNEYTSEQILKLRYLSYFFTDATLPAKK